MADFQKAIPKLLVLEGGYVNNLADKGGETKFGITKRTYPHLDIANLKIEEAIEIYKRDFWIFDDVSSQEIADKLFDIVVNVGIRAGTALLQRSLRYVGQRVKVDGMLGPRTLAATNRADQVRLLKEVKARACFRHAKLAIKDKTQVQFLLTWMRRNIS